MPRPRRLRGFFEPGAGWIVFRYMSCLFYVEQVGDLIDHAANLWAILDFDRVPLAPQTEAAHARLMRGDSAGGALDQSHF